MRHALEGFSLSRELVQLQLLHLALLGDAARGHVLLLLLVPCRLAPLSEGRIEADGTLQCSYHGEPTSEVNLYRQILPVSINRAMFKQCPFQAVSLSSSSLLKYPRTVMHAAANAIDTYVAEQLAVVNAGFAHAGWRFDSGGKCVEIPQVIGALQELPHRK